MAARAGKSDFLVRLLEYLYLRRSAEDYTEALSGLRINGHYTPAVSRAILDFGVAQRSLVSNELLVITVAHLTAYTKSLLHLYYTSTALLLL